MGRTFNHHTYNLGKVWSGPRVVQVELNGRTYFQGVPTYFCACRARSLLLIKWSVLF